MYLFFTSKKRRKTSVAAPLQEYSMYKFVLYRCSSFLSEGVCMGFWVCKLVDYITSLGKRQTTHKVVRLLVSFVALGIHSSNSTRIIQVSPSFFDQFQLGWLSRANRVDDYSVVLIANYFHTRTAAVSHPINHVHQNPQRQLSMPRGVCSESV
jgi:hypothetical protein